MSEATEVSAKKSTSKKKSTSSDLDVAGRYWDHLLEYGTQPASVFKFCKDLGIKEGEFYREYGSFEAIEARFWESTVVDTIKTLDSDEETAGYDARQLLLAFYFTYFEIVLDHRSKFLARFPCLSARGRVGNLKGFQGAFEDFAKRVIELGKAEESVVDFKQYNSIQEKGLYPQFRLLIDFYLKDTSQGFEDTDAFIEKSVRFFFDAARFPIVESTIDLLRFLVPRLGAR